MCIYIYIFIYVYVCIYMCVCVDVCVWLYLIVSEMIWSDMIWDDLINSFQSSRKSRILFCCHMTSLDQKCQVHDWNQRQKSNETIAMHGWNLWGHNSPAFIQNLQQDRSKWLSSFSKASATSLNLGFPQNQIHRRIESLWPKSNTNWVPYSKKKQNLQTLPFSYILMASSCFVWSASPWLHHGFTMASSEQCSKSLSFHCTGLFLVIPLLAY